VGKLKSVKLDRLRAAYQACGLSWHQLAKSAGVPHPTVSHLVGGQTKTVRPHTLTRLAAALQVPAEWLTGERNDLPHVPERLPGTRAADGPSLWERPTAEYVLWSGFMQRVEAALRRDLDAWYGEGADDAYNSWAHGLMVVCTRLASSKVWRSGTLEPCPRGSAYALWEIADAPSLNWLMHILEPWFAGKAYLNADILLGVFRALVAEVDVRLLGSDDTDQDALRGLERYAAARRKFAAEEGVHGPDDT